MYHQRYHPIGALFLLLPTAFAHQNFRLLQQNQPSHFPPEFLSADPPTLALPAVGEYTTNSDEEKYYTPVIINSVAPGDTIVVTYTPSIHVGKKMCIVPKVVCVLADGAEVIALPTEVQIMTENVKICFIPETTPLKEELGSDHSTLLQKQKLERSITIQVQQEDVAAGSASAALCGNGDAVGKHFTVKGEISGEDSSDKVRGAGEDYDYVTMNAYLQKGVVSFTVVPRKDTASVQAMIKINQLSRVESVVVKNL